ncbi:MAG: glutamine--fructose-6-phosphate transaminase (isomerizing), partial [Alphaproteobacteria bacterium]
GAATEGNAHPHRSAGVAVVHNGIIENFAALRAELGEQGLRAETDTDTETVAMLVRAQLDAGMTPEAAVQATLARLEGAFALLFLFENHPDLLIAARKGSPLAIGHGEGEMFVGSDAIALAPLTRRITYLEEGDWAVITRAGATIRDAEGQIVQRPLREVAIDAARIEKGGYRHYMMKEIAEQPTVIGNLLDERVGPEGEALRLGLPELDLGEIDRISIVACGTAYYAGLVAKYWFERHARLPVDIDVASEFRYREPPIAPRTLGIFVSQSGETADTLAALRFSKGRTALNLALVNVPESSIAREADMTMPLEAGPEVSVASTKAFTCQLVNLALLVIAAARARGTIDAAQMAAMLADLRRLPGLMNHVLSANEAIAAIAAELAEARDVLFLGRGQMFPLALEGALKLKEISYLHAEGYPSGELKHGPIALVDKATPTVVLAPHDRLMEKTVSNMQEVMARGGPVLLIGDAAAMSAAGAQVWRRITLPEAPEFLHPILYALPVQLLAYHAAVAKGTDVDQPRNLAKSVTVE